MYDSVSASFVEDRLKQQGEGLLKEGSSYANIFTGDAAESHFCASTGWRGALKAINIYAWLVIVVLNVDIILRAFILVLIEIFLAASDFLKGFIKGFEVIDELKFIPTRVGVSIVMRELMATYAKIDIARGLPIIHLNYFGYDEQAHRRGPFSGFARWTLNGIDHSIKKVWDVARHATRCNYDIWIYSDHGQELCVPFANLHGKKLKEAVNDLCKNIGIDISGEIDETGISNESYMKYPRFIGRSALNQYKEKQENRVLITAIGPVAHIYFLNPLSPAQKKAFTEGLSRELKIPLVISTDEQTGIVAWSPDGEYKLPDGMDKVVGREHPYFQEVSNDLMNLCAHPDRGDFILFGWSRGQKAISFPNEHGAHAGFGPEETNGFALLPADAPLVSTDQPYLHPYDLREAALIFLERLETKTINPSPSSGRDPDRLKIMTYNVHSCLGMDGKKSPERIARIIARQNPDIIALQELSLGESGVRQVETIAQKLRMNFNFHPVISVGKREFGNAILSCYPLKLIKTAQLPGRKKQPKRQSVFEPRGAILVEMDFNHQKVLILNTHLSLWWIERKLQIDSLLGPEWLGNEAYLNMPMIICGDFNATEQSYVFKKMSAKYKDAQQECVKAGYRRKTWSGRMPVQCLDHIFLSQNLQIVSCQVPSSELEKVSSDHLPFLVEVSVPPISV